MLSRSALTLARTPIGLRATAQKAAFSTSFAHRRTVTEEAKDTLKKVDRKVSDTLVSGIEKGEQVTEQTKSAAGIKAKEARAKTEELKGEAKGKAYEVEGQAKGKAAEVKAKI